MIFAVRIADKAEALELRFPFRPGCAVFPRRFDAVTELSDAADDLCGSYLVGKVLEADRIGDK